MKLLRLGFLTLPLLMLSGCGGKPLVRTEAVYIMPPAALMQDCPAAEIPAGGNNGDIWETGIAASQALVECNQQLARLREWVQAEIDNARKGQ